MFLYLYYYIKSLVTSAGCDDFSIDRAISDCYADGVEGSNAMMNVGFLAEQPECCRATTRLMTRRDCASTANASAGSGSGRWQGNVARMPRDVCSSSAGRSPQNGHAVSDPSYRGNPVTSK